MFRREKARPLVESAPSMRESLEDSNLVSFELYDDLLEIAEMCDGYYRRSLTKEQFRQLLGELQKLYEQM
jgi:hypothetical protein